MSEKFIPWHWEYAPHIGDNLIVIRQGKKIICRMNKPDEELSDFIVSGVNARMKSWGALAEEVLEEHHELWEKLAGV